MKPHAPLEITGDRSESLHHKSRGSIPAHFLPVDLCTRTAEDQVRGTDFRDIPLQKSILDLVAIVDLDSTNKLSWTLTRIPDKELRPGAMEMTLEGGHKAEIVHGNQRCQFTSSNFVSRLQAEEIRISLPRRKHCCDNTLLERM